MKRRNVSMAVTLVLAAFGWAPARLWAQAGGNAPASIPAPPKATSDSAQTNKPASWNFAVSGDSRNCGDVVMPAIAANAQQSGARFYWHLGDFRWISDVDEDISHQPEHLDTPLTKPEYQQMAWNDFIASQLVPFGSLRVYLGAGNHDSIPPKTHAEYLSQFAKWLDWPNLRAQRLQDNPADLQPRSYYHWIEQGVDFINLDNASGYQFDPDQLAWFEKTLRADSANPKIRTIVAGMHEALPESISRGHSMNQSEGGTESGRRVYVDLLKAQNNAHKRVYVLASHSHYFMDNTFNTPYWNAHGGVLAGWIVGTAGAVRYSLPPETVWARAAETNVYGFLLGTVHPNGVIDFVFQPLDEANVPPAIAARYTPEFVHWCFAENSEAH